MDIYTYLVWRRLFIFLDEWLFYFSLYFAFFILDHPYVTAGILTAGVPMMAYSYWSYGKLEESAHIFDSKCTCGGGKTKT